MDMEHLYSYDVDWASHDCRHLVILKGKGNSR
jgi:hypothetical protein